jgi:hypothetical protein
MNDFDTMDETTDVGYHVGSHLGYASIAVHVTIPDLKPEWNEGQITETNPFYKNWRKLVVGRDVTIGRIPVR